MKRTPSIKTLSRSILQMLLLCVALTLAVGEQANAQSMSDLKNIKVDELSDDQIRGYIQQAEARGLTESQLLALAKQQNVPAAEIAKLQRRIANLGVGENNANNTNGEQQTGTGREVVFFDDPLGLFPDEERDELSEYEKSIFGYALFQKGEMNFSPNLNVATPLDYELGPGDQLVVDLWGATQQLMQLDVSTEGMVRPENLSPIYVNGLSIAAATTKIIDRLSQINQGLKLKNGEQGKIFYQVSLGNIRTISVDVVGEVNAPARYDLPALATAYTALHAAGGPTTEGTFRNIKLVRDNQLVGTIDVYNYLTDGVKPNDLRLKNGDVIIVSPFTHRVEVKGEAKREGLFEVKEEEVFDDLLKYAGGFTSEAYKARVTINRNTNTQKQLVDVLDKDFQAFQLQDGDEVNIGKILNRFDNRVLLEGATMRTGAFQLTQNLTLKSLIEKAGGVRGDAYLTRATIYRTNSDLSQTPIPVDLQALLKGEINDVPLQREDIVKIPSLYDLQEEYYIEINGEVSAQGVYPFFPNMTVEDLVTLSGGLKESATTLGVEIARRNRGENVNAAADIITFSIDKDLKVIGESRERILMPFDQVFIRKSQNYEVQGKVTVEGEAVTTGAFAISRKDERISDILNRAGGLTNYADAAGALLIRKTEFAEDNSPGQISRASLEKLRDKILNPQDSSLNTEAQEMLKERLQVLAMQSNRAENEEADGRGSQLKKGLIEDIASRDSLITKVEIKEEEPVAIDLQKIIDQPGSKYDLIVQSGDVISIPGKMQTVRIAGEVTSPLNVRFDKAYNFKDYIQQAGGFMATSKRGRSYVQYPNGERKGVNRFLFFKNFPDIRPGSTIFVAKKPEREGMNAAQWLGIASTMATLALTINQLTR